MQIMCVNASLIFYMDWLNRPNRGAVRLDESKPVIVCRGVYNCRSSEDIQSPRCFGRCTSAATKPYIVCVQLGQDGRFQRICNCPSHRLGICSREAVCCSPH